MKKYILLFIVVVLLSSCWKKSLDNVKIKDKQIDRIDTSAPIKNYWSWHAVGVKKVNTMPDEDQDENF